MKVKFQKLRAFFLKNKNSSSSWIMWGGLFLVLGCALVLGYLGGYDRKEEARHSGKVTEVKQSSSTSTTSKKVETPKPKEKATSEVQPKVETSAPPISQVPQEPQTYTAQYGAYTGVSSVSYDEAYQEAKQAFENAEKARIEQEEQENLQVAEELKESILQQDPNAVVNIIQ